MKILMVCLGNICRSPLAEGIMLTKIRKYQFNAQVDSAGVIDYHSGERPDDRAIAVALKNKVDISDQKARQFKAQDFNDFDLIFTMDQSVHDAILNMPAAKMNKEKVKLFLNYSGHANQNNVPDPYFGGPEGFDSVYALIDEGCEKIISKLKSEPK